MREGLGQLLLAEGQLADGPDLGVLRRKTSRLVANPTIYRAAQKSMAWDEVITYWLQGQLDGRVEGAGLEGNDLGGRVRVVGDGRATLGAEDAVDGLARAAFAGPALGRALDRELVLGHDRDERYSPTKKRDRALASRFDA